MNLEEKRQTFIKKAQEKFGDKFDYSKVQTFVNAEKDKVCIICKKHGEFFTTPRTFLNSKNGCRKCAYENRPTIEENKLTDTKLISIPELPIVENPLKCSKAYYVGTVYCFINTVNNKLYIGETVRSNFEERFNEHRQKSEIENYPGCTYFYHAVRKYGWDAFNKVVIFQTQALEATEENKILLNDLVNEKEIYFIKKYNTTNHKYGYNITAGGDGVVGYKFSEEARKKMSEAHKGENHWNYGNLNNKTSKPILQFDLDFNFIQEWPSAQEIYRQLKIKASNVTRCCNNVADSCKGYIWVKKSDYFEGYLQKYKSRVKCRSNDKEVMQYDFLGNYINKYISAAEARRAMGNKGYISGAAHGTAPQACGYIWIYSDEFSEELLNNKLENVKNCMFYNKIIKNIKNSGDSFKAFRFDIE